MGTILVTPGRPACGMAVLAAALVLFQAAACVGGDRPVVEVTAPAGPVRVGEPFTVVAEVGWDGEGGDLDVGRPSFEVPESLIMSAAGQESRTVMLEEGSRSTKEYGLVFTAEKEGVVELGPFSLNAKRGDEEFGLTGRMVEIEVVGSRRSLWAVVAAAVIVFPGIAILVYRRKMKKKARY